MGGRPKGNREQDVCFPRKTTNPEAVISRVRWMGFFDKFWKGDAETDIYLIKYYISLSSTPTHVPLFICPEFTTVSRFQPIISIQNDHVVSVYMLNKFIFKIHCFYFFFLLLIRFNVILFTNSF